MNLKRITLDDTVEETVNKINENSTDIEENMSRLEAEFIPYKDNITLKTSKIEKELNDYKATMQQINIHQNPTQKASGHGIVSLPKNAAEGQVSVSIFGNTETDEEGGTKSTVSAMRLKGVGKNLLNLSNGQQTINGITIVVEDGEVLINGTATSIVWIKLTGGFEAASSNLGRWTNDSLKIKPGNYTLSWNSISGTGTLMAIGIRNQNNERALGMALPTNSATGFLDDNLSYAYLFIESGAVFNNYRFRPQLEIGEKATDYESYKESNAYVIAKDEEGNILELRSLPNGTKDEINVTDRKLIKRIGEKSNIANGMVIDFADMAEGGTYYAWNDDGETEAGVKGDTLGIDATTLTYQLAEPIEIPIQVSGSIVSYPNGTIYIERILPDAGVYTDKITILYQDAPIKRLDKLSKVDFMTGVETELDINQAEISEDKLSFTHPELNAGDIVFFEYEYDVESTEGETEVEFYDSRYVVKDDVTGKFYKWNVKVSNGTPTIEVVEV